MCLSGRKLAKESSGFPAGFSLIEIIVALALLGTVLLGVAGLFIQASQSIGGARDTSEALGIASSMLEELASWDRHETLGCLGIGEGAGASVVNSLSNPCAGKWQPAIESRLPAGRATVSLEPLGGPSVGSAPGLRITVRLDWTVKDRPRRVALSRVRV